MHLHELRLNLSESQELESKIALVQKLAKILEYTGEVPSETYADTWEIAFQILAVAKSIDYPRPLDLMMLISRVESKTQHIKSLTDSLVDYGITAGVIGKTIKTLYDVQDSLSEYDVEYKRVNIILDLFAEIQAYAFGDHAYSDKFKQKMAQTTLKKLGLDHLLN